MTNFRPSIARDPSHRTKRWLGAAALLLLGLYFCETLITGEIAFYIAPQFFWLAGLAGLIFLAMGAVNIAALLAEKPTSADSELALHPLETPGLSNRVQISWLVLAIIAFPVALGVFLPAKPLSASAIGNGGLSLSLNSAPGAAATFTIAPQERNVLDWSRAFSSSANPDEFAGQPADVIGFVYRDIRFAEASQFMVGRLTMVCCTADALAIGVIIETTDALTWPQDSWVRVRGQIQVRQFDGQPTPMLIAESIEPTDMPARPYLFQ
jgi:putative membrane protein